MTDQSYQTGKAVMAAGMVFVLAWAFATASLHAQRTPQATSQPADDRVEPPEPTDSAGLWAASNREPPKPDATTRPAGLDWDAPSVQVVPELLSRTGDSAVIMQLSQAGCRIDVAARSDFTGTVKGALRYAWRDGNTDGLLTTGEVQVGLEPPTSEEATAQLEQFRAAFEAQALGNLWNTFLLNQVRTAKSNAGYEIHIQPRTGTALQTLGFTEMQLAISEDYRIRTMRVRTAQGAESVSQARNEKIDGRWFAAGYLRRTSLANGITLVEDARTEHRVIEGIPLITKLTIRTTAEMPAGQAAGTIQQEFAFSDWKVVKRPKPLTAAQIIALRLLHPAGVAERHPPVKPEPAADGRRSSSDATPAPVKKDKADDVAKQPPAPPPSADRLGLKVAAIEKYVSPHAHFVAYKPKGWKVEENSELGYLVITVADPTGRYQARLLTGFNSFRDLPAIIRAATDRLHQQFPDYRFTAARQTPEANKLAFDTAYTDPARGRRAGRGWVSTDRDSFVFASCDAPAGEFLQSRDVLLTILANIRICKDTIPAGSRPAPLTGYRLTDGSASFSIPQGWKVQELGRGQFLASDPQGAFGFLVAKAEVLTPEMGVSVSGVPVSRYLPPSRALPFLCEAQGVASNFRIEKVYPRADVAEAVARVYTAGQVTVEEFVYTCDTRTGRTKGYTFGFSFGSRLGTNWSLQHLTVSAPADRFEAFAATFAAMLQSYRIDDEFARRYVAEGMARVRQMQQETARIIAKNASEIRSMMQAAYDERQRSQDYIDYLRTGYIRGTSDWISSMEGGTVYHSDSWGTRNTATGDYYEGQPYNYVNFEGRNPKYNEQMTEINNRQLYEQVFGR